MARKQKKELSMRKIREVLRLGIKKGLGNREIGRSCSLSHGSVSKYLKMAKNAGLTYPGIEEMNDAELLVSLKNIKGSEDREVRPDPDWKYIHHELKKKGVTLRLLWEEYKEDNNGGYQSSQFYEYYSRFRKKLKVCMRQVHKAGEKMFTDYAGQTIPITDGSTGKIKEAQLFVSVLGASNYTYAECTYSQNLSDWIGSHVRTFEFYGGVPQLVIPDNLKSGVTKACRYEPDINPSYHDMAIHYGTAIIPARVRKPQDKAKVEAGVLLAERWILAALRNRVFFSLFELNEAIGNLLNKLNSTPFQKLRGSRESWFNSIDSPALLPLPSQRYIFMEKSKG